MTDLTQVALLTAWERGTGQPAGRRALGLLMTAAEDDDLESLSIGERDAGLLTLRERLFGPAVAAVASCPRCGERQELAFVVDDIRVPRPDPPPDLALALDGYDVRFRLPTGVDLDALAGEDDVDSAAELLLDRCLVATACGAGELPGSVIAAVAELMAEADPQADIRLTLWCDACDHEWSAPFDIADFLWSEVDAWAWRLLGEVHRLAQAYGWSERDVLALSPLRRQVYLELAGR